MVTAFVLIMSKTGKEKEVLRDLHNLDEVKEASIVFGDFDIVAKIDVQDMQELNELMVTKIRKMSDVSATTTLIGV